MDPKPGQFVELFFRSGLIKSGIIIEWSDKKSVLKSNNNDLLIVQHTLADVYIVNIISEKNICEPEVNKASKLRGKQLAELHLEKSKLEKEELAKRVFSIDKTKFSEVTYGLPKYYSATEPRALINTGEKVTRRTKKDG